MTKEVMKLALEALETTNKQWKSLADSGDAGYWKAEDQDHYQLTEKAITAIKEALKQEQDEPVGWINSNDINAEFMHKDLKAEHDERGFLAKSKMFNIPVYTKPQPKQKQDEPMAYLTNHRQRLNITINPVVIKSMPIAIEWEMPLYAKPQAKEWVSLTEDDDIDWEIGGTIRDFVKAIDAKLREKNGYK